VGKAHFEIFGGLVPDHRCSSFVNQDLDPYLQRLYIKFRAAPCVTEAVLCNRHGGNIGSSEARYERVPAKGWQDFVSHDTEKIREYLQGRAKEAILLDVIVPSYRVRLDYLQSICFLKVPDHIRSNFIIIVDNPDALLSAAALIKQRSTRDISLNEGERILEEYLSQSGNTVRVRCNKTNVGCSASRNRGLDESAAEFILNLDDDLVPNPDLLEQYGRKLLEIDSSIVGLLGLVRFPRSPTLPLRHAAVLMSYLTFMFEIAERNIYTNPAWGVTANICFRRTSVRFDAAYAKSRCHSLSV
jgi:Glycosyl transferase family 2